MITTLQSLDNLLNRFDELSQCHSNLLSEFETKLSEFENPLRDVTRTKEEQRKTAENLRLTITESRSSITSSGPLEDFHRRVLRYRYLHRPPNYSSNDQTSIPNIPSKSSFESLSPSKVLPIVKIHRIEPMKIFPQRLTRGTVKTFSMETINRLSQPKRYNRVSEAKPSTIKLPKVPPSTIKRPKKIKNPIKIPPIRSKLNIPPKPIKRSLIPSKIYDLAFTPIKKLSHCSFLQK